MKSSCRCPDLLGEVIHDFITEQWQVEGFFVLFLLVYQIENASLLFLIFLRVVHINPALNNWNKPYAAFVYLSF